MDFRIDRGFQRLTLMAAPKEYTPLPGRGMRRQGVISVSTAYSRLYMAEDHLLSVDTTGFTEDYKRFYYRDIQAFIFRRTNEWLIGNLVLGFLSALILWGILAIDDVGGRIAMGIFGLIVFIPFLVNLLAGPTCSCSLRTAVQTEELPSLSRLRRARKTLAILRPRIEAAQGSLSADEMQAKVLAAAQRTAEIIPGSPAQMRISKPPRLITRSNGRAHTVFFWIAISDLPFTGLHLVTDWEWLEPLAVFHMLAILTAGIVAVVRQQHTDLPRFIRALPWVTTITLPVMLLVGIIYGIVAAASGTMDPETFGEDSTFTQVFTFLSTTITVGTGLIGLLRLKEYMRGASMPPAFPPPTPPETN